MELKELPAVAKNVYYSCTKCDRERYFRVLTHLSTTEARIECEVCGSKRKLNIGKKMAKKATTTKKPRITKKEKEHLQLWQDLQDKNKDKLPEQYKISGDYSVDTVLDHPNFGIGVVTVSLAQKIEVIFEQGVKNLIHKR